MTDENCLYCNREGECTKGLPGTPCEVAGCVAPSRISDGFHTIDYDEDKPAIQALVEDVAELYLRTDGDGDKMEPYGAIAEEGNKYQEKMSRQEKSPYCGGITIKRIGEDYVEVESEEIKV